MKVYIYLNIVSLGKRLFFLDDIIETGNSLKAAERMLEKHGIEIIGAFYLMDASTKEIRNSFNFPIRSLLRFDDIFDNNSIKYKYFT